MPIICGVIFDEDMFMAPNIGPYTYMKKIRYRASAMSASGVFSLLFVRGYWHVQHLGPLLLTWSNFNPSMDKMWDEINYPFPNVNGATLKF